MSLYKNKLEVRRGQNSLYFTKYIGGDLDGIRDYWNTSYFYEKNKTEREISYFETVYVW